jgi:hypothetical protein
MRRLERTIAVRINVDVGIYAALPVNGVVLRGAILEEVRRVARQRRDRPLVEDFVALPSTSIRRNFHGLVLDALGDGSLAWSRKC